jgi:hypothetical protein
MAKRAHFSPTISRVRATEQVRGSVETVVIAPIYQ